MIGKRLKEVRKKRGYTQAELAKIIGVSLGTIKKWEQDIVDPNSGALISLALALSVSIDYLFDRDVPMDLVISDPKGQRLVEIVNDLPENHREALLQYAELLKGFQNDK
jgi:transcriptional regulator with XRE-family HTH domain